MSLRSCESEETELEIAPEITIDKFDDSIKSGESKFKLFSFQPSNRNEDEIAKCVDFWKFIEGSQLRPAGALELSQKASTVDGVEENEEEIGWKYAYKILKTHKLDVLAKSTTNDIVCNLCKEEKNLEDFEDDFNMEVLNDFDPQRKYYNSVEVQTDFIETADVGTMTDFIDPALLEQEAIRLACEGIDELMSQVADKYRRLMDENTDCDCDVCFCNFPKASQDLEVECRFKDKCTCSCGEISCLCTQLSKVLTLNKLAQCECRIRNQQDVNVKFLVQEREDLVSKCNCSCEDLHCPCTAILDFFQVLDDILFGVKVSCACSDPTACLEENPYVGQCQDSKDSSCKCPETDKDNANCVCGENVIKEQIEIISCSSFISDESELIASIQLDENTYAESEKTESIKEKFISRCSFFAEDTELIDNMHEMYEKAEEEFVSEEKAEEEDFAFEEIGEN